MINSIKIKRSLSRLFQIAFVCLSMSAVAIVNAQVNTIESLSANQQGSNIILKITTSKPLTKTPNSFSVGTPPRVALDFSGFANATSKQNHEFNVGDLRSANIVQAGDRTRLVMNLAKPLSYAMHLDGNVLVVTIDGSGAAATPVNSVGLPVINEKIANAKKSIRDIDFRRGVNGEGKVIVELPIEQVGVDVRQQGQKIIVDFQKVSLPDVLRRRVDLSDLASPIQTVTTTAEGENVRMIIEPAGLWEHLVYQSDTQYVIEVKPIKEDPNKLTQGTQGYKGERISLNFHNIDTRAILQILAEVSGLNIIVSDTVAGTTTLRLKDVPWDQALDVVMQTKNLDMRKNGNVVWVAPKDELLTKEKLELEQKAQIADLEPLRTESFQLNYQKAEAFKQVFGVDNQHNSNRLLSKRGSATIDVRTNQLFVTDIPSKLEEVRKLVQKTDIPSRQVLIEARIVEADDKFSKSLGAKLGFADMRGVRGGDAGYQIAGNQRVAVTGNYIGVGEQTGQAKITDQSYMPNTQFVNLPATGINGLAAGSFATSLFSAAANRFLNLELSALEADGRGKIISTPHVVTGDQSKARIAQGTELPYQVASASGATSITFRTATLALEVTPQITPDGNVILDVEVHKDSVGIETRAGYAIDTKMVKTIVLVENGGTVVLGGIYQQNERDNVTKVPFFGDLPLFGNLFKSTGKTNDRTELLVFITPKVISDKLNTK